MLLMAHCCHVEREHLSIPQGEEEEGGGETTSKKINLS